MGVLDEILATKRDEVAALDAQRATLLAEAAAAPAPRGFAASLRRSDGHLAVIAEVKRRSPSKGDLAPDLDPTRTAVAYAEGGASALSVLTDRRWFGGSIADLTAARGACRLPVLRKDFVLDEVQIHEARVAGADAVLLIVAGISDDGLLRGLHDAAFAVGLDVLTEVHDPHEAERAVAAGARVVGVNSRNLQTFGEDLSVGEVVAKTLPAGIVRVAESAIRAAADARRMADAGFDAVLVGEALVRSPDPTALVRAMAELVVAPCS